MTDNIVIRPAGESDLTTITSIYADAVSNGTASYELEPPDIEEMTARWQALTDKGFPYLVAERGGTVVGYCYVSPFRPRPTYRYIVESTVYVAPDAQRTGVGRTLMRNIIDICETMKFRQMIAIVGDENNQRASIGLHEALGFRHIGIIEGSGYKFDRWLDTLIMQRTLGVGKSSPPSN